MTERERLVRAQGLDTTGQTGGEPRRAAPVDNLRGSIAVDPVTGSTFNRKRVCP